jgi:hypothetical protein
MAKPKKPKADPLKQRTAQVALGIRPLWILTEGAMPVLVSSSARHKVDMTKVTHFQREGDPHWRPIAELLAKGDDE